MTPLQLAAIAVTVVVQLSLVAHQTNGADKRSLGNPSAASAKPHPGNAKGVKASTRPVTAAPRVTSLTNPNVRFSSPSGHFVALRRGPVTAVVVDNHAVDSDECPKHRAGFSGLAVLRHSKRAENLFYPGVAGLNFEHIHDGTLAIERERFEPRKAAMELRLIDEHTVELYQPPTPHTKLESCGRYQILDDGTIEYTFECIPRAATFANGYIGLFWASYLHQVESTAIHFRGVRVPGSSSGVPQPELIRAASTRHGLESAHRPFAIAAGALPRHDPNFPLTLVFNTSPYAYTEPWYYGVSHGFAYAQAFSAERQIWFSQSPDSGGAGEGNPAWDFAWFIPNYQVGRSYGFRMRVIYVPFKDQSQVEASVRPHVAALNVTR